MRSVIDDVVRASDEIRHHAPAGEYDESRDRYLSRLAKSNAHPQDECHENREHDIELLFDGQRPEVLYRRGSRREQVAVRLRTKRETPVGRVAHPGQKISPQATSIENVGRQTEDRHRRQRDESRRHKTPEAAAPESRERKTAGVLELAKYQLRDQEAREREEQRHSEETTTETVELQMEEQHRQHGERPQSVDSGHVGQRRTLLLPHGFHSKPRLN